MCAHNAHVYCMSMYVCILHLYDVLTDMHVHVWMYVCGVGMYVCVHVYMCMYICLSGSLGAPEVCVILVAAAGDRSQLLGLAEKSPWSQLCLPSLLPWPPADPFPSPH